MVQSIISTQHFSIIIIPIAHIGYFTLERDKYIIYKINKMYKKMCIAGPQPKTRGSEKKEEEEEKAFLRQISRMADNYY